MRLGTVDPENFGFHLPLRSPFTIFVEYRMWLGIVELGNFGFIRLCARLSLYLSCNRTHTEEDNALLSGPQPR